MRLAALPLALVLCASAAYAQAPAGWTYHDRVGGGMRVAIACTDQAAFMRNWQGTVSRWDGSGWTALPPIPSPAYGDALAASPDGHLYTVASGRLAHWDGHAWEALEIEPGMGELPELWARDATHVYMTGAGRVMARDGARLAAYDAGTWRELSGIWGSGGQLWTAGQGGTVMVHDGHGWTRRAPDTEEWLQGITGADPQHVWTWSQHRVYQLDGDRWRERTEGLEATFHAIATTGDQTVAVGSFGLARLGGSGWTIELAPDRLGEGYHDLVGACFTARHLVVADNGGHAWTRAR